MPKHHVPDTVVVSYCQAIAACDDDSVVDASTAVAPGELLDEFAARSHHDVVKSVEAHLRQFREIFLVGHLPHLGGIP